jgi:hypothetical protein
MRIPKIRIPGWVDILVIVIVWTGLYFGWHSEPLDRKLVLLAVVVTLTLESITNIGLTAKRDHTLVTLPINVAAIIALWFSWNSEHLFWKLFILFYCILSIDLGLDRLFAEKLKKDRKLIVRGLLVGLTYLFLVWIVIDRALHHDYLLALVVALVLLSFAGLGIWSFGRLKKQSEA